MLPLVSVINSRFLSVNPALISLILIHPVLRVAILPLILATHHSHHPPPLHSFIPGLKSSLLQILPIVASCFFSRTESTDSPNYYRYFWAYPFLFFSSSFFLLCLQCFYAKEGHPAWKTWVLGCCLECGADLHMAQLMPLPLTVSCFSKIQIGFTFLVPVHLGSVGKRAVKLCIVVVILLFPIYSF